MCVQPSCRSFQTLLLPLVEKVQAAERIRRAYASMPECVIVALQLVKGYEVALQTAPIPSTPTHEWELHSEEQSRNCTDAYIPIYINLLLSANAAVVPASLSSLLSVVDTAAPPHMRAQGALRSWLCWLLAVENNQFIRRI